MAKRRILLVGASGYVGARLRRTLEENEIDVLGCDQRPPVEGSGFGDFVQTDYAALPNSLLRECDLVLWFAGHSNVRIAQAEPWGSLENNVFELARLFKRLSEFRIPVIYASTASVLSSAAEEYSPIANESRSNAYDASKLAFDILVQHTGAEALGLRMSTVCGWSPSMRWDLVFNAMNRSAAQEGIVRVQNSSSFRSLLFIEDLCTFVTTTVRRRLAGGSLANAPQVALGSWSGTIGTLAAEIAAYWRVPVETGINDGTYSFVVADRQLSTAFPSSSALYRSIGERCEIFAQQNDWTLPR